MSSSDAEKIKKGALATAGVYGKEEIDKACELLAEFSDQSIETVRLVFVDQHGILRGKTLVTSALVSACLLYTSPSPRDGLLSRMPSSA